jgi:hypothetical protein
MPNNKGILSAPAPTKEPGQQSINISDLYLTRFTPPWSRPGSNISPYIWRAWVMNQPVAVICRDTLVSYVLALDWTITPRDPKYRQELDATIRYYTKLFDKGGMYPELNLDWTGLVEWLCGDLLDLPFGCAVELGRKGSTPNGRVMWMRPLDGATLYPTLNRNFPIVQYYQGYKTIAFSQDSIARTFYSPQQNLYREGWGMAPPEKIYFAMDLLTKGDKYFANLMLDVPTAGILDLGDMDKESATQWVDAFKTFINDTTTSFKIPVLCEHNNKVEFIPLGKVPNDIMYDRIILKYAAITAAGYGLGLSDIGIQSAATSGETLAGSIRQERKTRNSGTARVKSKVKYIMETILPDSLQFNFIDYDDERNVSLGRARLASATAFNMYFQMGAFSKQEIREQTINDGLVSLSFPTEIPPDAETQQTNVGGGNGKAPDRPGTLGVTPVPVSGGGHGEKSLAVQFKSIPKNLNVLISNIVLTLGPQLYESIVKTSEDELLMVRSVIADSILEDGSELQQTITNLVGDKKVAVVKLSDVENELGRILDNMNVEYKKYAKDLQEKINSGISTFMSKAIAICLNEVLFTKDVIDENMNVKYDSVVEQVQMSVTNSLNDFVSIFVQEQFNDTISEIQQEMKDEKAS